MPSSFFLTGCLTGFSIAAPVGPIGVLCIRRSLANGPAIGFSAGLGAATSDAAYGAVAGFGLTAVSSFLERQQAWLSLIGGVFLCHLGIRTFLRRPAEQAANVRVEAALATYFSTLFLTLTNPATIISFVGVFVGLGIGRSTDYWNASTMVGGVFAGSAFWWLILSFGVGLFRGKITPTWMQAINRFSGALLTAFGLYTLCSLIWVKH